MKEAKKERCEKCKEYFYVHDHHILKKSIFGEGETKKLCPNCHTHYHEYLKKQDIDPEDMKQNLYIWLKWFYTVAVIAVVVVGVFLLFRSLP